MADHARQSDVAIIQTLFNTPERFDAKRALALLKKHYPDHKVEFKPSHKLKFPKQSIEKIDLHTDRIVIHSNFLATTGQSGILENELSSLISEKNAKKEPGLENYLQSFETTAIEYYADSVILDIPENNATQNTINALNPKETTHYFSGLIATRFRSAQNLKTILSAYTNAPVLINEFEGKWFKLPMTHKPLSQGFKLGEDAIGRKAWICDQQFSVTIGPMTYKAYLNLFLTGRNKSLKQLIHDYAGSHLNHTIHIKLENKSLPNCRLNNRFGLGFNAWLKPINLKPHISQIRLTKADIQITEDFS